MPRTIDECPPELAASIREFWPEAEWNNAASVSFLESAWDPFAVNDTTRPDAPCGTPVETRRGIVVTAELSVGYFQINACNFPAWDSSRLYNARHNAGTAHMLWDQAGQSWAPWHFTAGLLGLLP